MAFRDDGVRTQICTQSVANIAGTRYKGFLQLFVGVPWRGSVTIHAITARSEAPCQCTVSRITYTVLVETLNPAQSNSLGVMSLIPGAVLQ